MGKDPWRDKGYLWKAASEFTTDQQDTESPCFLSFSLLVQQSGSSSASQARRLDSPTREGTRNGSRNRVLLLLCLEFWLETLF